MRRDRLEETDREKWLGHILQMDAGSGSDGENKRLGAETVTWKIWKEQCRAVYDGDEPREPSQQPRPWSKNAGGNGEPNLTQQTNQIGNQGGADRKHGRLR